MAIIEMDYIVVDYIIADLKLTSTAKKYTMLKKPRLILIKNSAHYSNL